jgi:pseudouridine synthase
VEEKDNGQRLARLIAHRGVASRREAEAMIERGEVLINGQVEHHPGARVDPEVDHIRIDGKPLPRAPERVYYLLYKPRGYITSRKDPEGRQGVHALLKSIPQRVEPVGRLDINTEGVLLCTNDGALASKLLHPSTGAPRRYVAKVWKTPTEKTLRKLARGQVYLEDGRTGPARVRVIEVTDNGNAWLEITVHEGRNRLVRRMLQAVGHPVAKLRRESFATVSCRGMERGEIRKVSGGELRRLREIAAGVKPARAGKARGKGFAKPKVDKKRRPGRGKKKAVDRSRGRAK